MPPPWRHRQPRFWRVVALMTLGACIPLDLYAANLFFIGCPVHRMLNLVILRYLLNVSLALLLAAFAVVLVGVPVRICRRRITRSRDRLFAGE